jgi:hypothetical protein|tara:strand:- start:10705 stop:11154 length:450 start_codon:yes stop_codon:yes gene_type:complete
MPYILIILGLVFLVYVISRLIRQSNSPKLTLLFRYGGAVVLGGLAFLILIRGNVAVAAILGGLAFFSAQGGLWRFMVSPRPSKASTQALGRMTKDEALSILDLTGRPSRAEIKEAHHKLMMKMHPDQGGSDYFATKLNQARDILLEEID